MRAAKAICIVRYPDRDATADIILSSKLASQKVGLSLCVQKNRRTIFLKLLLRQMSKFTKESPVSVHTAYFVYTRTILLQLV
jgi:hypothetical protein